MTEPATRSGPLSMTAGERLRAGVSELSSMSETCLADAHAVAREHPGMAGLLNDSTGKPPASFGRCVTVGSKGEVVDNHYVRLLLPA